MSYLDREPRRTHREPISLGRPFPVFTQESLRKIPPVQPYCLNGREIDEEGITSVSSELPFIITYGGSTRVRPVFNPFSPDTFSFGPDMLQSKDSNLPFLSAMLYVGKQPRIESETGVRVYSESELLLRERVRFIVEFPQRRFFESRGSIVSDFRDPDGVYPSSALQFNGFYPVDLSHRQANVFVQRSLGWEADDDAYLGAHAAWPDSEKMRGEMAKLSGRIILLPESTAAAV